MEEFFVNYLVPGSMWLAGIGAVLAVLFPIVMSLTIDPKSLIKGLIGIVVLGVVFFISYSMSVGDLNARYAEYNVHTEGLSQSIGGILTMTYILLGISVVGIVFTEVSKILK